MRDTEHQIQVACVNYFRYRYPQHSRLLFAVPNGGQRNVVVASKLKAEGVVSGVADLLLFIPKGDYHALCIEMKTTKGKQSDNQKEWESIVTKQGYKYVVCHSLDEFMKEINTYYED